MAGYNFFGPFFEAQIINADEKTLTLTPNGKAPNLPIADSLDVRILAGEIHTSVTLKPHSRDLGFALLGDPSGDVDNKHKDVGDFIRFGNILKVKFGYSSDPTHNSGFISGLIVEPDVNIGSTIEFTINAKSPNWFAKRSYNPRYFGGSDKSLPKATKPIDVIKEICKEHSWDGPYFYAGEELTDIVEMLPSPLKGLEEDSKDIVQPVGVSDWEFIRRLCHRNGGEPEMNVKDGKYILLIRFALTDVEAKPVAKFIYGTQMFGGESNIFPILGDISTINTGMFISRKGNINLLKYALNKEKVEEEIKPETSEVGGTTVEGGAIGHGEAKENKTDGETGIKTSHKSKNKGGGGSAIAATSEKDSEARLKAQIETLTNSGLTIEFDTVGIPFICNPSSIIKVEIGKTWLNGNYRVVEAHHKLGTGGYSMHLKAVAQGTFKTFWNENMEAQVKNAEELADVAKGNNTNKKAKKVK